MIWRGVAPASLSAASRCSRRAAPSRPAAEASTTTGMASSTTPSSARVWSESVNMLDLPPANPDTTARAA